MKYMQANNKVFHGHSAIKMPMKDLWQSVESMKDKRKVFYQNLLEDIRKKGMENPLIAVKCSLGELWIQKAKYKDRILEVPGSPEPKESNPPHTKTMHVIWGGSNRYCVLKELGYSYVDCIIIDGFQEGFKLQSKMRQGYNWLNTRKDGNAK